jgi:hypothetical protein
LSSFECFPLDQFRQNAVAGILQFREKTLDSNKFEILGGIMANHLYEVYVIDLSTTPYESQDDAGDFLYPLDHPGVVALTGGIAE